MSTPLKDIKEGLSSARKCDITHVRTPFLVYTSRPCEYGSVRYVRANFVRPVSPTPGTPTKEDFLRFRAYLRAGLSHIVQVLDAMEYHQSQDPDLLDIEGMKTAAYAVDTDEPPCDNVGASLLPHVAPACSSLMMAITQAVRSGLLPADPGTPWVEGMAQRAPAERARVEALQADRLGDLNARRCGITCNTELMPGGMTVVLDGASQLSEIIAEQMPNHDYFPPPRKFDAKGNEIT